jgi:hypothetical protein
MLVNSAFATIRQTTPFHYPPHPSLYINTYKLSPFAANNPEASMQHYPWTETNYMLLSRPGVNVLSIEDTTSLFGVVRRWSTSSISLSSTTDAFDSRSSSEAISSYQSQTITMCTNLYSHQYQQLEYTVCMVNYNSYCILQLPCPADSGLDITCHGQL